MSGRYPKWQVQVHLEERHPRRGTRVQQGHPILPLMSFRTLIQSLCWGHRSHRRLVLCFRPTTVRHQQVCFSHSFWPWYADAKPPFSHDRLADPAHVTPATIHPAIPVEPVDKSRYALRTRNAKQLNPYVYDQLLYKKQMRAIPDAIIKVVSPIKHSGHVDRIAQEMLDFLPDGSPSRPERPRKRKSTNHTPPESDHSELSDSRLPGGPAEHRTRRKRPGYRVSGPKIPRPFPFHDPDVLRSGSPLSVDVRMLITLIVVSHYS